MLESHVLYSHGNCEVAAWIMHTGYFITTAKIFACTMQNSPVSYSSSASMHNVPCLLLNAEHDLHLHHVSVVPTILMAVSFLAAVCDKVNPGAAGVCSTTLTAHLVNFSLQDTDEFAAALKAARVKQPPHQRAIVETGTIADANHFTIVGSIGQAGDVTTKTISDFVHRITQTA